MTHSNVTIKKRYNFALPKESWEQMVLNLKESGRKKVRRIGEMKWINICILGVFHFSPPLAYRPVQDESGPMFSSLSEQRVVR